LVITIPLLYLVYGTVTQFLTILLIVGIPVTIYTYNKINKIEKLYPELPPQKKEVIMNNIEYFEHYKNKLKKHFGNVMYAFTTKKQLNELNIVLNFQKFIADYDKYMEYEDIMKKIEYYMRESTRSNDRDDESDDKSFWVYEYDEARDDINFNKLKDILKENEIPIINYIRFSFSNLKKKEMRYKRIQVKLKNSIFY